jgi:anti-sigma regulatory factor (Ser/Thr protein kinase)
MGDDDSPKRTHVVLADVSESVPRARHLVRRRLREWRLEGLVTALELAVGELVANAIRYGKGPIEVILATLPGRVRLEVRDRGGGRPAMRTTHESGPAVGGWGLHLVDQLVDRWGAHSVRGETTVWVEKAQPPATC